MTTPFIPPAAQADIDARIEYHKQLAEHFAKDAEETDTEDAPESDTDSEHENDTDSEPLDAAHSVHVFQAPKKAKKKHKK